MKTLPQLTYRRGRGIENIHILKRHVLFILQYVLLFYRETCNIKLPNPWSGTQYQRLIQGKLSTCSFRYVIINNCLLEHGT